MPNWKFHNDWAVRFDIPRRIAANVNYLEDSPQFDQKGTQFEGRVPAVQPTLASMRDGGTDYVKAWLLHLLIDYLEDTDEVYLGILEERHLTIKDLLVVIKEDITDVEFVSGLYDKRIEDCDEFKQVATFVGNNLEEICKQLALIPPNSWRLVFKDTVMVGVKI